MKILPLRKKSFYLDVTGFKNISKLKDDILRLGGSVEEFLSKEIKYLVTIRSDWRNQLSLGNGSCDSMSPNPCPSSRSSSFSVESSSACGSSHETQIITTRGQSLLEKSKNTSERKGSCDIIQNAHRFGTKIVSLNHMLEWIARKKVIMKTTRSHFSRKRTIALTKVMKIPYIKYESFSRAYRPMHKEFRKWPTMCYNSDKNGSPFSGETLPNSENRSQCRKEKNIDKKVKHIKWYCCEICGPNKMFDDIDKHIKMKKHVEYSKNYKALDDFIRKFINVPSSSSNNSGPWEDINVSCSNRELKRPGENIVHGHPFQPCKVIEKRLKLKNSPRKVLSDISNSANKLNEKIIVKVNDLANSSIT